MTKRSPSLVFLERQAYKRRRMRDLARALLLSIPLLWTRAAPGGEGATTSQALVYVFTVWVFLICLAALISRVVKSDALKQKPADPP